MDNNFKSFKTWCETDPDPELKYKNFQAWFKKFRDNGGRIGRKISRDICLDSREWEILKSYYKNRKQNKSRQNTGK